MSKILLLLLLQCMTNCMVRAKDRFFDFQLEEVTYTRLCMETSILTVNGSFPGPTIQVNKGDTAFINVHNNGGYGVTIHWHGVKQPRNPWSDGPEYITQCAIQPGTNFTQKVIFSAEEGTLWWHAHSDWTQSTVHGAIVILPAEGTSYPFPEPDGEQVIVLGSWFVNDVNKELDYDLMTGADLPRPQAYVINGQPGPFFNCSAETTYRMSVDYGKTYLLRIVNAVLNGEQFFAIADHNVTVVGMDGSYLKPLSTSYVVISPGQTIDVLFTADQPLSHYYMAGSQLVTVGAVDIRNATAAIIEYRGNYTPPSQPGYPDNMPRHKDIAAGNGFLSRLRSLASQDHPAFVPQVVTHPMFIVVSEKEIVCPYGNCTSLDGNKISSALNNITFQNPTTDILLAYYRNMSGGVYTPDFPDFPEYFYNFTSDDLPNNTIIPTIGTKIRMLKYNESVEIVFQDTDVLAGAQNHPVHLHGHSFFVVGSGLGNFNNETDPKSYNLVDPPELNTVRVPKNGWVTVRFMTNNPGTWLLHCHFTRHFSWGMKTVFIVQDGGTPETSMLDPPPSMPSCTKQFVNYIHEFKASDVMQPIRIDGNVNPRTPV